MKRLSRTLNKSNLSLYNIRELIDILLDNLSAERREHIIRNAVADAIYEEEIIDSYNRDCLRFAEQFDFSELSVPNVELLREQLMKLCKLHRNQSIPVSEVLDIVISNMSEEQMEQKAKDWLYEEWYLDNSSGDKQAFIDSLDSTYWGLRDERD